MILPPESLSPAVHHWLFFVGPFSRLVRWLLNRPVARSTAIQNAGLIETTIGTDARRVLKLKAFRTRLLGLKVSFRKTLENDRIRKVFRIVRCESTLLEMEWFISL